MRTRNRSTQLVFPPTDMIIYQSGSIQNRWTKENLPENTEVMIDQVNPGYFPAVKLGKLLPVSPMSHSKIETTIIPGSANFSASLEVENWGQKEILPNFFRAKCEGVFGPFDTDTFVRPDTPEVNKGVLLQGALASAQTNAFDKLTFAAEFHKTVEMFATARSRFADHFQKVWAEAQRNARRSGGNDFNRMIDFMTEAWFEWRFGLRPIIYDIEAAQEMLRRLAEGSPILSRGWQADEASSLARSGGRSSAFIACNVVGSGGNFVGSFGASGTSTEFARTWTRTVHGRAAVGVNVTTRDLTMADPIVTMWELTPMSVFIDYFVSIGDMLAAFSPFATGTLAYATYTRTVTDELVETARWTAKSAENLRWSGNCTPSTVVQKRVFKQRTLEPVTPTLALNIQLDMSRVFDLLALSWALRRRLSAITRMLVRR